MKLKPKLYTIDEACLELNLETGSVIHLILKNNVPFFLKIEDLPLIVRRWKALEHDQESYGVICASGYIELNPNDMYYEEIEIIPRILLETDSIELSFPDKEFFNNFKFYNPPEMPWKRNLEWRSLGEFELDQALDFEIALPEGLNAYSMATENIVIKRAGLEILEKACPLMDSFESMRKAISEKTNEQQLTKKEKIRNAVNIFSEWLAELSDELAAKDDETGAWRLPGTYANLHSILKKVCPELFSNIKSNSLKTYIKTDKEGSFRSIVALDNAPDKGWNWEEELNKIQAIKHQKNINF